MSFLPMRAHFGAGARARFATPPSSQYSCGDANVLCVSQTAGATQEYTTIQAAANAAQPGQVVLVHPGSYTGFTVNTSGTSGSPIKFIANGSVIINQGSSSEGDGIRLQNVNYVTIEGFTVQNNGSTSTRIQRGIAARGATVASPMIGNVIRNNTVTSTDAEGVYISQFSNGLVEGNTISQSGQNGAIRMHGIYLANAGSNNTVIRYNTIFNNPNSESNGIHCNGDISIGGNGVIRYCTFEGNLIYGNGQNGFNFDGVQDSLVQNNLVYGNSRHAVRDYLVDAGEGPARMKFVNNTLVSSNGWAIKFSEDLGNHVLFNNILIGTTGSLCVGSSTLSSNYNVTGGNLSLNEESTTISLATWRTSTSQDANSVTGTTSSVFANAAGSNYTPSSTSPARELGVTSFASTSAPTTDRTGMTRNTTSGIDAGALEFAA